MAADEVYYDYVVPSLKKERQRAEENKRWAEQEAKRAEQEKLRVEQEKQRAERLAEKLRAMGIDPDDQ